MWNIDSCFFLSGYLLIRFLNMLVNYRWTGVTLYHILGWQIRDIKICIAIHHCVSQTFIVHPDIFWCIMVCTNTLVQRGQNIGYNLFNILGKRVRLKSTTVSCSIVRFNDLGTVTAVDYLPDWKGRQMKLWIKWDNGSNYPLIDGVDSFDIFGEAGI